KRGRSIEERRNRGVRARSNLAKGQPLAMRVERFAAPPRINRRCSGDSEEVNTLQTIPAHLATLRNTARRKPRRLLCLTPRSASTIKLASKLVKILRD